MRHRIPIPPDELRRLYEDEHLGTVAIAQIYQCSAMTISTRLRRYGIPARPSRFRACAVSAADLIHLYLVERCPVREIARRLQISVSTLHAHRRRLGLPPRSRTGHAPQQPTTPNAADP